MSGSTPLSPQEREQAFRRATSGFAKRFAEEIENGMSDEALEAALHQSLDIFGGSGGPGELHVTFQGSGLKIWASREVHNHVTTKPFCQGASTVKMAREVYTIVDPTSAQMALL
ncbi:MAG: hypothetical protein AAGL10_06355 [Pseudomonadota bacterium]